MMQWGVKVNQLLLSNWLTKIVIQVISGNKTIAKNFNNYFDNIGNTFSETISDRSAFENCMSSANVGEPFKFSTARLESLEAIVGSLKNSSPGHDAIPI